MNKPRVDLDSQPIPPPPRSWPQWAGAYWTDAAAIAGVLLLSAGLAMAWPPLAVIWLGVCLLAAAYLGATHQPPRRKHDS